MLLFVSLSFTACSSDDDDEEKTTTTEPTPTQSVDGPQLISGNYVGTLKPMGYTDEPARAYITITRKASDAVLFECKCETFKIDTEGYILTVTKNADGGYYLSSESNYAIEGTYKDGALSISFKYANTPFFFSGYKN